MQLHDVSAVLQADGLPAGAALATLEWHRGYQADAEVDRLLRQHNGMAQARASRIALRRQAVGAALVRAGKRLAGVPPGGLLLETAPPADTPRTAG
jgi:hypothetical protein